MDSVFVVVKGVVLTVLAFGLMIFIHEFGHFLAAKLIGVRVERFSFGMGPRLVGRVWGGTDYMISAIPIGGYVKLAGGDEGEEATGAKDEFVSKTPGQRTLVLLAGPLFSVLFGIPLAMAMFTVGRETYVSRVSYVAVDSPAWKAGVEYGDHITRLGGRPVATFEQLRQAVAESVPDQPQALVVRRDGQEHALTVNRPKGASVGVSCVFVSNTVMKVEPDTPAAAAGLHPDDVVASVDGHPLRGWFDFRRRILASPGHPVALGIERGGKPMAITVTPKIVEEADPGFRIRLPREVGFVRPGYPADGKLQPGDRIAAANGKPVEGWWDIEDAVAEGPATAALSVERGSETLVIELPRGDGTRLADTLGIAPRPVYVVASLQQDLPLKVGDHIVKIGHNEVANALKEQLLYTPLDDLLTVMAMSGSVTVRRGDVDTEVQLQPGTKRGVGQVGISPVIANALHKETFFGSFVPALKSTASISTLAFVVLGKLFSRDIPVSELMGPVGIIQNTYISATRGISDFFWLVHLITVNIGVFNLLPVPPLDGGRIVMLAYEKVRGRQPSRRVQEAILLAGVGLVLLIFVVATFNDLRRIFF